MELIHKFEAAGLGKAPFRFVGVTTSTFKMPDGSCKPGSSCDYCSTGIMYEFWCISTDGKKFKVGCDCIYKIESKTKLYNDVERAELKLKKELKATKDAAKIAAGRAKLAADAAFLADKPHPMGWNGKTLRDYVEWMFKNAGTAGKLKVCKVIENN